MKTITYSLKADQPRSDAYYRDIAIFTGEVIEQAEKRVGPLVDRFQASAKEARTRAEFFYELLALGVFWQVYAARALQLSRPPQRLLSLLANARQRSPALKPIIDGLRGPLAALFLARNKRELSASAVPTRSQLARLLDWMEAAGDFDQEVERLRVWLGVLDEQQIAPVMAFAEWFTARSLEKLGCYTPNVETFLAETHPHYRWREDYIFCGRQRVEYHLGMVGTEILNRAFRNSFLTTQQKIVLVPPCMRARPADECQARETPFGAQCAHCEPRCHVHQVTKLGEKHGFAVFMLPDELASFSPAGNSRLAEVGIVGVSCPLTNAQGGWKARKMGIPAQGLPLDYCGCSWHWHLDGGIPTTINFQELLRILRPEIKRPPVSRRSFSAKTHDWFTLIWT